jgi:hypothetical protein
MKLVYRLLKIFALVVIVSAIALFSASLFLQDRVAGIIINSFNEKISTKYDIGSIKLSFIRKFPKAYLDLKNVVVHSSPGFDLTCFPGINTDTLLSVRSVSVEFKITDIIKEVYNIDRISIKEGFLNLFSDTAGMVNYKISVKSSKEDQGDFILNLDRINLHNLKVSYDNRSTNLDIKGFVETGRLKSRITGDEIDFNSDGDLRIDMFRLYNFIIKNPISTNFNVALISSGKGVEFKKSIISFDGYIFGLSGAITADNVLDLALYGDNIDISGISRYLPETYKVKMAEYSPGGTMKIVGKITGSVSRTVNPDIMISFSLNNGTVTYLNSPLTIKDMSFECIFNNGPDHIPSTSMLTINNFKGKLGSADYNGSFIISDFINPEVDILLHGKIILPELKEFFSLKEVIWSEGNIDIDLKMHGPIPRKEKYSIRDILNLDPVSDMRFNSFGIGFKKKNLSISKMTGDLFVSDTITAKNLNFKFRNHSFTINGRFKNLPGWLIGDPVILTGVANASCERLNPESLFPSLFSVDTSRINKTAFSLPGDIILDLKFLIDSLSYKNFSAGNVNGTLSYKPRIINFKTLTLNSLGGLISGNGFVVQNTDKSFIGRGTFTLDGINVKNAFSSFNDFGQAFLKAENIDGKLSGTLSVLMPMDSLLKPVVNSLSAEGKYTLADGSLMDFNPVKSLSSYIELSELEDIRFEKLENDFFIKNNFLYIPQMDIKSSAADFLVNGVHSFENDYEYHIKILLSELLSKKFKKPKPNTSEFGAVKDDGLGRTTVVLKIEDKGDDVKVGYDVKAASDGIKSNIRAERQNLKTILNQEYGWFKNDTTTQKKSVAGTPRFKITWEETDTVNGNSETPPVKKESTIKSIFKKK